MANTNFTRSRNGYDPQEVDAVIAELQNQISDFKFRNGSLTDTIAQFNEKVRQLAENTKRLEAERIKESLRLSGFLNQAAQMAEQTGQEAMLKAQETVEEAQREAAGIIENTRQESGKIIENAMQDAERIREQAQSSFVAAQLALNELEENVQAIRKSNDRYITEANARLAEIDSFVNNAKNGIPTPPPAYTPSQEEPSCPCEGAASAEEACCGCGASEENKELDLSAYEEFVRNMMNN